MKRLPEIWQKRMNFAALGIWLILGAALAVIAYVQYGKDFRGYYAATTVLLEGGNPYDYHQVVIVLEEVTGFQGNNPYYYPPWFAWIFIPLVPLPFSTARALWMLYNYLLWNIALVRLHKALGWSLKGWRLYGIFAMATFSFAWITWRYEQAGILVFAILVEALLAIQAGKDIKSGIWLALLLIKPNVTLLIFAGLGLWLLRNGQKRALLIAFLVLFGLLIISTAITPNWYDPVFEDGFGSGLTNRLDGPDRVVAYRINSTFLDWLGIMGITRSARNIVYAGLSLVGLVYWLVRIWKTSSVVEAASASILVSLTVTPYALQYDYPVLVIPFFLAFSLAPATHMSGFVRTILAVFILTVIFWQQNVSQAYWMVVGLIAMELWRYWQLHAALKSSEG